MPMKLGFIQEVKAEALSFFEKAKEYVKRRRNRRVVILASLGFLVLLGFYFVILKDLPSPAKLASAEAPQSTQILDRNGELLFNIYRERNSTFVPLSQIPKHMQEATLSIEDKSFYYHGAIDLKGITRALYSTFFKQELQGGSTLTQQLVKNSLLTPERTILRKVKEVILAYATEAVYSKDQIFEMYLNQTPYGGTAWGVEAAAKTYFDKPAKDLTLSEAAFLAGLPEAPSLYSPYGSRPDLAKKRQALVLSEMVEEGYITESEKEKALKAELKFKKLANPIKAPHFVLYVKELLVEKYGQRAVEEGGLKVLTSLDIKTQEIAEATVAAEVSRLRGYRVSNGAALVTNPKTGEILAMVGSKDYFDKEIDGNVNVTIADTRQPGSSIKPINYAVGLMKGYTAATPFVDSKICFPNQGGQNYCPVNYDGKFHGVVSMRTALASSINIPAVKMLKLNGLESMISTASAMGITTFKDPSRYGLALTLGGGEVKMVDMATAFGVFANNGYRIDLQPILKVTDPRGRVLEEYKPVKSPIFGKKVLPEGVSFIISDILSDNGARTLAFGENSLLRIPGKTVPVKTGTTNDFRDNWTIGYTPSYVVAVWVGNNDNTPMSGLVSGVTGAAPIWNGIMRQLLANKPDERIARPSSVIARQICANSGLLPGGGCQTRLEYFIIGTEPKRSFAGREKIWVNKDTKQPPPPGVKDENLELKEEEVVEDPTGEKFCASCPTPTPSPSPSPGT
jgi:1A family penicillin-binding protein